MPLSLSTALTASLNALTHKALVIDRTGIILFMNNHWKTFPEHYRLSQAGGMAGSHYLQLFEEWITIPVQLTALANAVQDILQGGRLISSSEFFCISLTNLTACSVWTLFHYSQSAPAGFSHLFFPCTIKVLLSPARMSTPAAVILCVPAVLPAVSCPYVRPVNLSAAAWKNGSLLSGFFMPSFPCNSPMIFARIASASSIPNMREF